jgi:C4-dicarboxylate-specific signal transduction histidine kinase
MNSIQRAIRLLISLCGVASVTFVGYRVFHVNETTAGFAYLLLVLVIASTWGFMEATLTSIGAALAFDYYFVPFEGFLTVRAEDWIALVAFVATSLIASYLSTSLRRRSSEAIHAERLLRQTQGDLTRISRVITMGELAASLAHEINQPIAAAITNANTCVRWLTRDQPDVEEAREAASRMAKDALRAAEVINSTRLLFAKGTPKRELLDVNEVVREIIVLLRREAMQHSISVRTELAEELPKVMADRVQLQQVLMNLVMNSIDAMKEVDRTRELNINSQKGEDEKLLLSVRDSGVGLPKQGADQLFNSFFTTKPDGLGMGLRISRSIVESHGGRLWAGDNSPHGATLYFTLPTRVEDHE